MSATTPIWGSHEVSRSGEHDRINRVLIVEDDSAQRATLSDIVEQEGFLPIAAADAADAMTKIGQSPFGVAVLDYRLPDTTGIQLLERIKALHGDVRVIIHTGFGSFSSAKDAINLGAFAYVEKGSDPRELVGHIHRAVRSHYQNYAGALESTVEEQTLSLQESEARYRALIESFTDGIAILDEGRIVFANRSLVQLIGCNGTEEVVGQSIDAFLPGEIFVAMRDGIPVGSAGVSAPVIGEFQPRRPLRRQRVLEIRGIRSLFDGRPCVQLICRDVTETRKAEEHQRLVDANLRETQKMETAGQLAAGIAHDFNNLLTVILGNAELLRDRIAEDQDSTGLTTQLVAQIEQAGNRAAALTGRLLTFSRRQPVNLNRLDLNKVIAGLSELLKGALGDAIRYSAELSAGLPPIQADVTQLEQIIMNLALNARDAMPDGGRFTFETSHVTPDQELLERHPDACGREFVRLTATDSGTGIPQDVIDRVFEPFFTTKPAGKGTGLGLATVYGIVKQAGGIIEASNLSEGGSRFAVYWPSSEGECETEGSDPKAESKRCTGTVLLCEDDPCVRDVAAAMLKSAGFSVLVASNGKEAIQFVDNPSISIDLLLSDIQMPELRGDQLASHFRATRKDGHVILMTGSANESAAITEGSPKGPSILLKPFKRDMLISTIEATLARDNGTA